MSHELHALALTAASLGFFHTLLGPDHYLPFVAMAQVRNWGWKRCAAITLLCGIGHVGSSILLGAVGIAIGSAVTKLEGIEALRGELAGWALLAFGIAYTLWGLRRGWTHGHDGHHDHGTPEDPADLTPWILFVIFIFGPCEPLIPILIFPAATHGLAAAATVAAIFSLVTLTTMLAMVMALRKGVQTVAVASLHRWSHALAGATLLCCGLAIQFGL